MHVVHTIPPVFDAHSRVLVLGTMPSPRSRAVGFYYGHPQNRFWRVMEQLAGIPQHTVTTPASMRRFALESHLALWDTLASCDITGASDASIAHEVPNDLEYLLSAAPIELVITTGTTAHKLCQKYFGALLDQRNIPVVALPSTSPANARMSLSSLVEAYRPALAPIIMPAYKRSLRTQALAARDALPHAERIQRSSALCRTLIERQWDSPQNVLAVYASMRSEVCLDTLIRAAYRTGAQVAFPCMERTEEGSCMHMRLVSEHDYQDGTVLFLSHPAASWQPASTQDELRFPRVCPRHIDHLLVPLVAFDARGGRLGYGAGNYDRFLPQLSDTCCVAGVAFAEQELAAVPREAHDFPLEAIFVA